MSETTTEKKPEGPQPAGELKTLDYYLEHPGEMPVDTEALEKLFGDYQAAHPEGGEQKPAAAAAAAPASTDKPGEEKPAGEPKIDGILAKDGKHVIPYAEMERRIAEVNDSREQEVAARKAAEDYVHQLEGNIQKLSEQMKTIEAGGTKPTDAPPSMELPKELMDTLKQEFPTIAKAVEAQQMLFKHASDKLVALEQRIGSAETERSQDVEAEVEDLIGQVPELKTWRDNRPFIFARAQQVEEDILKDKTFMEAHPDLAKDDVARYKEVVKRVRQEIGLPAEPPPSPEKEKTDLEKAEAALAAAKPTAPNSLSDMPAGKAPASSQTESFENLSGAEIGNRLMQIPPDKILEAINRGL